MRRRHSWPASCKADFAHLAQVADPRSPHGRRFSLLSLLATACAAILCGQTSCAAIAQWARNQPPEFLRALGFFRWPPTDGGFRYLFARLDLTAFEAALAGWIAALIPCDPEPLRPTPLDGKVLCGSDDRLCGALTARVPLPGGHFRALIQGVRATLGPHG